MEYVAYRREGEHYSLISIILPDVGDGSLSRRLCSGDQACRGWCSVKSVEHLKHDSAGKYGCVTLPEGAEGRRGNDRMIQCTAGEGRDRSTGVCRFV